MKDPKTKILLADDDEGIVDSITMMLEIVGYQVSSTYDGDKVIPGLQESPDLVILDTWMSGVDGREVCKAIKSNPATSHIPVLMISASHEIKESALAVGADQFISKPFEMNEFLSIIERLAVKK